MESDELVTIENLLHEHQAIRANIQLAANLITDQKLTGINRLTEQDRTKKISQIWTSLRERLHYFDKGFRKHSRHEEDLLSALTNELLKENFLTEHREMEKELGEIDYLLSHSNSEGLLLSPNYIKVIIDSFQKWVVDHSSREDILFNMLIKQFGRVSCSLSSSLSFAFSQR